MFAACHAICTKTHCGATRLGRIATIIDAAAPSSKVCWGHTPAANHMAATDQKHAQSTQPNLKDLCCRWQKSIMMLGCNWLASNTILLRSSLHSHELPQPLTAGSTDNAKACPPFSPMRDRKFHNFQVIFVGQQTLRLVQICCVKVLGKIGAVQTGMCSKQFDTN